MTIDDLVKGSASLFDFFISTMVFKNTPNLLFNSKALIPWPKKTYKNDHDAFSLRRVYANLLTLLLFLNHLQQVLSVY